MTELIVALDTGNEALARQWVEMLGDRVDFYKVGLELFTAVGPGMLKWLKQQGKRVFLDLKFHDIPNTAAGAVAVAADLGVDMCTIHASGGADMLRACRERCRTVQLLAVTVLTSLDEEQLAAVGQRPVARQVQTLASLARDCGIHGVVCAPPDLPLLAKMPKNLLRVTPGIRPAGVPRADQRRVTTPAQAAQEGATHIVVGRSILAMPEPVAAAERIIKELANDVGH